MTRATRFRACVLGKVDGLEGHRLRRVRNVADRAGRTWIGAHGCYGGIGGMSRQRAMTALTADARMRVHREDVGNIGVAFHARQAPGIDDGMGLVLRQGAGPIRTNQAVIRRDQQPPQAGEQRDTDGEQRRESKQVLVRGEPRHASTDGKAGTASCGRQRARFSQSAPAEVGNCPRRLADFRAVPAVRLRRPRQNARRRLALALPTEPAQARRRTCLIARSGEP